MQLLSLPPAIVQFVPIELELTNELLVRWSHKMGPIRRGKQTPLCYALLHNDEPVAVTTTSALISNNAGGVPYLRRENTVELSRLCASRPGLCRVALRLWREYVWTLTDSEFAVSYQDADLHNGNTYRFDGWGRVGFSHSGKDTRSGRPGRDKWLWVWPKPVATV